MIRSPYGHVIAGHPHVPTASFLFVAPFNDWLWRRLDHPPVLVSVYPIMVPQHGHEDGRIIRSQYGHVIAGHPHVPTISFLFVAPFAVEFVWWGSWVQLVLQPACWICFDVVAMALELNFIAHNPIPKATVPQRRSRD